MVLRKGLQLSSPILLVILALLIGQVQGLSAYGNTLTSPNTPGDLDLTFGNQGLVTTGFYGGADQAYSVVLQPDGKIIVAGLARIGGDADFALARYNANGSLDATFGNQGLVTTGFAGGIDEAYSVVLQTDGKIVVAGWAVIGGDADFALARYNANGSLDATFGNQGLVTTGFNGLGEKAMSVVLQPNGRIVVAGFATINGDTDFALARYNANGSLDTTFGNQGLVNTGFAGDVDIVNSVVLQSDGKIVVAGVATFASGNDYDFALARYNTNGSLDTTFGNQGLVNTGFAGDTDEVHSVALQSDGKIVVAGTAVINNDSDFALARYNTNGSLDATFGNQGLVTTGFYGADDRGSGIVIQPNGKIVAAGYAQFSNTTLFALSRYNTNGSLDTTFGDEGLVLTDFAGNHDFARGITRQPDGKIVVVGYSDFNGDLDFAVARYIGDSPPTATPTPTNTPILTPTNTPNPSPTASHTHTPTTSPEPTVTPSITPSNTPGPSPTATTTPTITPTNTPGPSPTATEIPTATHTPTRTPTHTPGPSPTATKTATITPTNTPGPSPTPTITPTVTPTDTPGPSPTITSTETVTPTSTAALSPTATATLVALTVTAIPTSTPGESLNNLYLPLIQAKP